MILLLLNGSKCSEEDMYNDKIKLRVTTLSVNRATYVYIHI